MSQVGFQEYCKYKERKKKMQMEEEVGRKKKKRQTEEEMGRKYQRVDRNGLCQLS